MAGKKRRLDEKSAAIAACASLAGMGLLGILCRIPVLSGFMAGAGGDVVRMLFEALCFGAPAVYLLLQVGKNARPAVRPLSQAHILWLALTGVLALAPATLLGDICTTIFARFSGAVMQSAASGTLPVHRFMPVLLGSVIVAPICEELFFRGMLLQALRRYGEQEAVLAIALAFALCHGLNAEFLSRALMGVLLGEVMLRMDSLLAPMALHIAYNAAVVSVACLGLGGLFSGLAFVSCALRLLLCAGFAASLKKLFVQDRTEGEIPLSVNMLSRGQWGLAAAAVLAVLLSPILGELI